MSATIEFYHDLASPNAYLANKVLKKIAKRQGATIKYTPILLGGVFKATNNQAPWLTFAPVKEKMSYMQVEMERFIARHGLTDYTFNPHFPLNTLMLSRGEVAADLAGNVEAYIAAGEALVWEDGMKMDDPEVFVEGFNSKGLDGQALLERTQNQEVKDKLMANTEEAVQRGAFGVPTFFIGEEIFFGKDTLRDIEDLLIALREAA